MNARFVIVDIGCIECGASTEVLGVYDDETAAREAFRAAAESRAKVAVDLDENDVGYFIGEQHRIELFEVAS